MLTIIIRFGTNKIGSGCEIEFDIPKDEWEGLSNIERSEMCLEAILDSGLFEYDYNVEEKQRDTFK